MASIAQRSPTAWINKTQLEVGDLCIIHGLLCQEKEDNEGANVRAPLLNYWEARVEVEWGVPVVVISHDTQKTSWLGNPVWEESRITLEALVNKIDGVRVAIQKGSNLEYERLLGVDIIGKLDRFKERATHLREQSWISRLFHRIRSCFSFTEKSIALRELDFRAYFVNGQEEEHSIHEISKKAQELMTEPGLRISGLFPNLTLLNAP